MRALQEACRKEITWRKTVTIASLGGWGLGLAGGLAAIPPVAAVGLGIYTVGWSVGFFGSFIEQAKIKARNKYMRELAERFPKLKSLYSGNVKALPQASHVIVFPCVPTSVLFEILGAAWAVYDRDAKTRRWKEGSRELLVWPQVAYSCFFMTEMGIRPYSRKSHDKVGI